MKRRRTEPSLIVLVAVVIGINLGLIASWLSR